MDSKERFSNRVDNYVKYRPAYPADAVSYLFRVVGFNECSIIADVGAGTGIFTRQLAERVTKIYAVEPNGNMRDAAQKAQASCKNICSIDAAAEHTTLPNDSVDFITAAQSFHWFDRSLCKSEFGRILKSGGKTVLLWNSDLFGADYEEIQTAYSKDYQKLSRKCLTDTDYNAFFADGFTRAFFKNAQVFDRKGFYGRILSSSYSPLEDDPNHEPFMTALEEYFKRHADNGKIVLNYQTEVIWGSVL
jgi:ubiquinone/menaquinone biosynthesis C-methylase UbiE